MSSYKLTQKTLKINNLNYYRSNGIQLGDVGTKRKSVFSTNRVDSQSNIPAPKIKVKYGETIRMDSSVASSVAAMFSYGGLSAAGLTSQLTNGKLAVARYFIPDRDMINGIEDSPKLIDTIRNIGRSCRVVSDVWVVISADLVEKTRKQGVMSFVSSGGVASGVSMTKNDTSISVSTGAVIAYMLHKIDWKEKQKKNWANIDLMIQDPKGI